jgi:hypothetical protein
MTVTYDSHSDRVEAMIFGECFEGLVDAGEFLLTESRVVVPLDEATLERSGAAIPHRPNDKVWVTYDTPYAVRQHEELDWKHAPGRTAKYLEGPANEHQDTMLAIVRTRGRRAFQGGV